MSESYGDLAWRVRKRARIHWVDGEAVGKSTYEEKLEEEIKRMKEETFKGQHLAVYAVPKLWAVENKDAIMADDSAAIISILDTDALREFPTDEGGGYGSKTHTVWFDDIHPTTVCTVGSCDHLEAMSYRDALEVIHFINRAIKGGRTKLYIHCTAGVCRSGAVADFCRVFLDLNPVDFLARNRQIIPNTWVRDLLWAAAYEIYGPELNIWGNK